MLQLENITISYDGESVLENISFIIEQNICCALTGVSGVGKSTLLNIISGLQKPDSGKIQYNGIVFNDAGIFLEPWQRDIGMVFQELALWPHMTVIEHLNYSKNKSCTVENIKTVLLELQLDAFISRLPMQLSGGQQQRLALGRVLVKQPKILLLDEAFNQLDIALQNEMWLILKKYQKQHNCIILLVTHNLCSISQNINTVITLKNKSISNEKNNNIHNNISCSHSIT